MNQQPDKLFREKLEGYQKPAPASAWEKIAAAQSKKNDKWLWLKIAASIAFVAAAGYILLPENKPSELSQDTSTKPAEKSIAEETPQAVEQPAEDLKTENTKSSEQTNGSNTAAKRNKNVEKIVTPNEKAQQHTVVEEKTEEVEPLPVEIETNENVAAVETVVQPSVVTTPIKTEVEHQNVTLVYTAKDVEEYLDKKSLAEATSDSKKSSTLKKLLKKAEDLTNNQDPFGELRQKKNEILALNFKNEKQRGQNK
jgi:hypothetical protein